MPPEWKLTAMLAIRDSFSSNDGAYEATTSSVPSGKGREERASSVVRMRHPGLLTRPLSMSKSSSSPALKHLCMNAADGDLEVYVVLRNFQEFGGGIFHRLPEPLRNGLRDSGVCHYMTVFKQKDGTMVQFDFGPAVGGDIHVAGPGPLNKSSKERKKAVVGQVRERKLQALPDAHMFVGTTNMSLSEIRAWNNVHAASEYELHRSDCRHYVNALVRYTTGIESAAISALRHQVARHKDSGKLSKHMIRVGQYVTDAANWDRVRAIGHATSAAIMTLAGQQTLARFGAVPIFRSVGSKVIPASARGALVPVKKALFQRPVYAMSTAAVASTISTSQEVSARHAAPAGIRRNMVQTIQSAVRVATNFADTMTKTASNFVQGAVRRPTKVAHQISEQPRRKGPFFLGASSDGNFGHQVQHLAMIASRR